MSRAEDARGGTPPELWGGLECTVNRVRDRYLDQFELTGHARRPEDLDRVAALGIRVLRYPVHWEKVAPEAPDRRDWSFYDSRLERIRGLGMETVVGLLHHGSGPRYTGLLDPAFPSLLADHALATARRYPWVRRFTPVNEPLTTSRFCGLYGHWHPHGRDDKTFVRVLLAQVRGIALAMRAIREVIPEAGLVQTEDLGKIYSTPPLAYQAEFENHRRWLSLDLLCGRVDRAHPLWKYLTGPGGASEDELLRMRDEACPPDILGWNHYITSERFLDHRLHLYPSALHGGNGRDAYVDTEAVRACEPAGPGRLLREAWERYRRPVALTEVQLSGERENQLGWFRQAWDAARALRREGVDVRAITAWSLFGACDWNSLVTEARGFYEAGAFDARGPRPRATAVAGLLADLAAGREPAPVHCLSEGWWRNPACLSIPEPHPVEHPPHPAPHVAHAPSRPMPLLIAGVRGTLGAAFRRLCQERCLPYHATARRDLDIADPSAVARLLDGTRPWAVVNAAGYVRVDDAEDDEEGCRRENTRGAAILAEACAERGIRLLTFSTDLVFDGAAGRPYVESDAVAPLNAYGRSKAAAEAEVLARLPGALVARTSAFFGPWDRHNFVVRILETLRRGEPVAVAGDQTVSPTWVPDLVHACLDLLQDGESGIWHLANRGAMTWADLARAVARVAGLDEGLVDARAGRDLGQRARRPAYSALGSERGWLLPPLEEALGRGVTTLVSCSLSPSEAPAA